MTKQELRDFIGGCIIFFLGVILFIGGVLYAYKYYGNSSKRDVEKDIKCCCCCCEENK